jgi:hypothetical protein
MVETPGIMLYSTLITHQPQLPLWWSGVALLAAVVGAPAFVLTLGTTRYLALPRRLESIAAEYGWIAALVCTTSLLVISMYGYQLDDITLYGPTMLLAGLFASRAISLRRRS